MAFYSFASNLVSGDTNEEQDVFVHDRRTGITERVSVASVGSEGISWSRYPSISACGRYVAFESYASNLVGGVYTARTLSVLAHTMQPCISTTFLFSDVGASRNAQDSTSLGSII